MIVVTPSFCNAAMVARIDPFEKAQWMAWDTVLTVYKNNKVLGASNNVLGASLQAMRCHGNSAASSVKLLNLEGAVIDTTVSATTTSVDTVMGLLYNFSAPACKCVHDMHNQLYAPAMLAGQTMPITTPISSPAVLLNTATMIDAFNHAYVYGGSSNMFVNTHQGLLRTCFFGQRMPHWLVMVTGGNSNNLPGTAMFAVSPYTALACINILPCVFGLVCCLPTMSNNKRNQRLAFWILHLATLPVLILLHDAMQQQRLLPYLTSRLFMALGIALLAPSLDYIRVMVLQHDLTVDVKKGFKLQKAAWWCWGIWGAAVSCLLKFTSGPVVLAQGITDTVNGAGTFIPVGVTVYTVVMLMVSIPVEIGEQGSTDKQDPGPADVVLVSLRLCVDLVARMIITTSLLYSLST